MSRGAAANLVVLCFTAHYPPYNAGERAGFSPEKAADILRSGCAVREGDQVQPIHRDPIPLHRDPGNPVNPDVPPPPADPPPSTPLPDDFPAKDVLEAAGIASVEDLRTSLALGPLTEVDGIGEARATKIVEALVALDEATKE